MKKLNMKKILIGLLLYNITTIGYGSGKQPGVPQPKPDAKAAAPVVVAKAAAPVVVAKPAAKATAPVVVAKPDAKAAAPVVVAKPAAKGCCSCRSGEA